MSHFSDQYITDCDNRTSDDDYLDRRDGVSSAPVMPHNQPAPTYTKTINPAYETIGKRRKLTGYLAELHDGNILLHSQEYGTQSQAEQALDRIVYDLLTDLAEHGLVDDVPAALEAEQVSSTHLPSWQATTTPSLYALIVAECQAELDARMDMCSVCNGLGYFMSYERKHPCPYCQAGRDYTEPVDVEYAPFGFAA